MNLIGKSALVGVAALAGALTVRECARGNREIMINRDYNRLYDTNLTAQINNVKTTACIAEQAKRLGEFAPKDKFVKVAADCLDKAVSEAQKLKAKK
jgi:hypothetical protein